MSEKLYALLLRLYPSRFRRQYGDEAMQVFRDRLRDERGVLNRTRLWLDVFADLVVSAPREHGRPAPRAVQSPSGVPSFLVLEEEPLRPDRFLFGTVAGLAAVGVFGFLLTHGGNRVVFAGLPNQPLRSAMTPAVSAEKSGEVPASSSDSSRYIAVTAAERQMVIQTVIEAVHEEDPDAAEALSVAALLQWHERRGDYEEIRNGSYFALLLTGEIGTVAQHVTVTVMCGEQPSPGSEMWVKHSEPGAALFRRIDEHFAVAVAPESRR